MANPRSQAVFCLVVQRVIGLLHLLCQKSSTLAAFKTIGLLSIIIVNYNVKYFLEQCLHSVQKAIAGTAAEVIVIDNNSTDDSVAYLQDKFSWVRLVANTLNTGYAKANNQGWKMAAGDMVLFLNPDTILSEDCLQKSVAALQQDPKRGALGIHMLDGSGYFLPESKRGFPSPRASMYKLLGLIKIFPHSKNIAGYYQGHLPEKEDNEVDVLSGAYMMVKKEVLEKTGGFDEQFFMYGEDIDLSYRIQRAGYTNYYLAGSNIVHFKGESTKKNFAYTRLFYKAMGIFVQKHYGKQSRWFTLLAKLGIGVGGMVSYLRQRLTDSRPGVSGNIIQTLVVGDTADTTVVAVALADQPGVQRAIITARDIREMNEVLQAQETGEIIFCTPGIGYADIMACMAQLKGNRVYKFFARGSKCIVGSASKSRSGEVVVLNQEKTKL